MTGQETIPLILLKPLSRESILINSTDPRADPVFDYGTFKHPKLLLKPSKNRQFVGSEVWKAVSLTETLPGPAVQGDAAIETALRNMTHRTWSHPVGNLGMRPRQHSKVVDPQLEHSTRMYNDPRRDPTFLQGLALAPDFLVQRKSTERFL